MPQQKPTPPKKPPIEPSKKHPHPEARKTPPAHAPLTEADAIQRITSLKKIVRLEVYAIVALTLLLVGVLPFAKPLYLYYAMRPSGQISTLSGLSMPNMTNRAVISWAISNITEIMTMGFGDVDVKLQQHKGRFTPLGWESYTKAFAAQKMSETIKKNQQVVTTVPSNTPVILGQGVNADLTYQWNVQMPVIMTYATNDNIMQQKNSIVTLNIVRVPAEGNAAGIAIQRWFMK